MKKRFCIYIGLLTAWVIGQQVWAQQIPQFTQYRWNELFYNPAYAGSTPDIQLSTLFRGQWIGIEGRPITFALGAHTPIPIIGGGAGLVLLNDMLGAERHTAAYLLYSYKKQLKGNKYLQAGIELGAIQKSLNGTQLTTPEGEYTGGNTNHNDPALPNTTQSGIGFDLGAGLRYQAKRYAIGIAAKHIAATPIAAGTANIQPVPHAIIYGNYRFSISSGIDLEPALLVKTDFNQFQPDITLSAYLGKHWIAAAAIRGIGDWESAAAIVATDLNPRWRIGYSYDFPLSDLNNATSGSHELSLQYRIANKYKTKQGKRTYNPRFL